MKAIILAALLAAVFPLAAGDEAYAAHVGLHAGNRALGFRYEAGLVLAAGGSDSRVHLPLLGLDVLRSFQGGASEARLHVLGLGFDQRLAPGWYLMAGASPFLSVGGISGPGHGGEGYLVVRRNTTALGLVYWAAKGRPNPWDGRERSSELALCLRKYF